MKNSSNTLVPIENPVLLIVDHLHRLLATGFVTYTCYSLINVSNPIQVVLNCQKNPNWHILVLLSLLPIWDELLRYSLIRLYRFRFTRSKIRIVF